MHVSMPNGLTDTLREYLLRIQDLQVIYGLASTRFIDVFLEDPKTTNGERRYCATVELSTESAITPVPCNLSITERTILHFVYYDHHPAHQEAKCQKWIQLPFTPLRNLYAPELPLAARLRSAIVDEDRQDFLCMSYFLLVAIPVFPIEIIDHIIGFLADDKKALRACASTCYAWAKASRSRLFHRVVVESLESLVRLIGITSTSDRLSAPLTLMRSLMLEESSTYILQAWGYEALAVLWEHHPQVSALTMRMLHSPMQNEGDAGAVRRLCWSLTALTTLVLEDYTVVSVEELAHLLDALPRLRSAVLQNVGVAGEAADATVLAPAQRLRLVFLEIDCEPWLTVRLLEWLAGSPTKDSLEHLSFGPEASAHTDVYDRLKTLVPGLKSVALWGMGDDILNLLDAISGEHARPLAACDLRLQFRVASSLSFNVERLLAILQRPHFAMEHLVLACPRMSLPECKDGSRALLARLHRDRGVVCEYHEVSYQLYGVWQSRPLDPVCFPSEGVHKGCRIANLRSW